MIFQIFKNELKRNKVINITLFAFIMLAALLAASAANVIVVLFDGIDSLMISCATPHYVQMHSGCVDKKQLIEFNKQYDYISNYQLMETICIDGADISFNDSCETEAASVMDISFVKQNERFDYLLDMDNQIIKLDTEEIAVPIYYKEQRDLDIGDTLKVSDGEYSKVFNIAAFVRDSQMNPSLVSSKRFVVSENDHILLSNVYTAREYLIEYQFDSVEKIDEFASAYASSNMPQIGPAVDYNLFRMLNAMTDGIIVFVLILVSVLLIVIGILCLRFTLLGAIEEDTREIGVMKAIGIQLKRIKYLYLSKYILLSVLACASGFLLSFWVKDVFTENIAQYMGTAASSAESYIFMAVSAALVFLLVVLSCHLLLNRFKKISAVRALTSQLGEKTGRTKRALSLKRNFNFNTDIFMGTNAVLSNMKIYILIGVIFIISMFIIVVPINLLNTINSIGFVKYMGISTCHLRMDVRNDEYGKDYSDDLLSYIQEDNEISDYGVFKTYRASFVNIDRENENIPLEIGDFNLFPLEYSEGNAPKSTNQIALSVMAANSLEKSIGDKIEVTCGDSKYTVVITGIYQDITNGGKTAKAVIDEPHAVVLWYVVNVNVGSGVDISNKTDEYSMLFKGVKVTHMEEYLYQTLGPTISQLKLVTIFVIAISVVIASLISALFLKMLLAKEIRQIAILKSLGFNQSSLVLQYMTRISTVLIIGTVLGILLSATAGEGLIGAIYSNFGAPGIEFVIKPFVVYAMLPASLAASALITSCLVVSGYKPSNISKMIVE